LTSLERVDDAGHEFQCWPASPILTRLATAEESRPSVPECGVEHRLKLGAYGIGIVGGAEPQFNEDRLCGY
jgi:hypothetical protein